MSIFHTYKILKSKSARYTVRGAPTTRQGFLASGLFWAFLLLKFGFFLPPFPAVILLTLQVALV